MCCDLSLNIANVHSFPVFIPNDYLYTEYAKTIEGHENMEKWQIYAHAVHDFMKSQGGFGDNDQPMRDKVLFQKFIWGEINEISINGKTFYWPPRPGNGEQA